MNALRLIAEIMIVEAVRSLAAGPPTARDRIYDPYSLATRPLSAGLSIHPHPRGITAERAQRITGGAVR